MKPIQPLFILFASSLAMPAVAAWQRLPSLDKRPLEMSISPEGGSVDSSSGIAQAQSLVSDDPTLGATLEAGRCEAVINAGRQTMFETASFTNDGIEGKVMLSASADKKNWTALGQAVFSAADRSVSVHFAGVQAKYVRAQWELSKGGTIRNFQLFGGERDPDYAVSQNASGTGSEAVNLAAGLGGARIIYAHPSPSGSSDRGVRYNAFEFPESDERYRTVIYDLGVERILNQFGSVHSPRPVRFEVFAFNTLPEKVDWRGHKSFDPEAFDAMTPVAKAEDPRGVGYIRVKPDHAVKARYVALRWEPDYNPPAFSVFGSLIGGGGFSVNPNPDGAGGGAGAGEGVPPDQNGSNPANGDQTGGSMPAGAYPGGLVTFSGSTGGFGGGGGLPVNPPANNNGGGGNGGGGGTRPVIVVNPNAQTPR